MLRRIPDFPTVAAAAAAAAEEEEEEDGEEEETATAGLASLSFCRFAPSSDCVTERHEGHLLTVVWNSLSRYSLNAVAHSLKQAAAFIKAAVITIEPESAYKSLDRVSH